MALTPSIPCPSCARELQIRPDHVGQRVACKFCNYAFRIPPFVMIPCPDCGREGRVRTQVLGKNVRCKDCSYTFRALAPELPGSLRPFEAAVPPSAELEAIREEKAEIARQRDEAIARQQALESELAELRGRLAWLESERDELRHRPGDAAENPSMETPHEQEAG